MPVKIIMHFKKWEIYNGQKIIQRETNDIHYVNVKPPVFQIPYYEIKYGKFV